MQPPSCQVPSVVGKCAPAAPTALEPSDVPARASGSADPHLAPHLRVGFAGTLLILALLAYWQSLPGGMVYDDWVNFDRNPALRERDWLALLVEPYFGPDTTYWRPLTSLAMAVACHVGPLGLDLLALAAHTAAAVVVGALGWRLTEERRVGSAAAVLFLLHPLQVESVAWASALPSVLGGLGALLALHSALSWSLRNEPCWPWHMAGWLGLGLLAKESAVSIVPVLAVAIWLGSRPWQAKCLAVGALLGTVGVWLSVHVALVGWRPVLGSGWDWWCGCGAMVVQQVGLLAWPWPLTPFRAHPQEAVGGVPLGACLVVAVALSAVALWCIASRRFAARWRLGAALSLAPLLLSAVQHDAVGPHPLADRHCYLTVSGVGLLLAVWMGHRHLRWAGLSMVYGTLTFCQGQVWRDDASFVAHVAATTPDEPCVQVLVANQALRCGSAADLGTARRAYLRALDRQPRTSHEFAQRQRAAALAGLAWCDFLDPSARVAPRRLRERFEAALVEDRRHVPAWVGLGVALGLELRFEASADALTWALSIDPWCPEAWFNLAQTQLDLHQTDRAVASLQAALHCDPRCQPAADLLVRLTTKR